MKERVLVQILKKRSGIDFVERPELRAAPLLGKTVRMPPRELVYVLLDLEQALGITIPEEKVAGGKFDTFEHILEILEETPASC